ncbi:MAG: PKD domain-containing protein, partial [Candidatus Hydrogenedentes bacterium]|nr:PKD domain-containing protein [Candidatus Hydrogenedentota bacterium]
MCAIRGNVTRLLLMVCLTAILAGCPLKGDNGLTLLLTPETLDFGADEETLTLQVHRNLTNAPVEPVVVSSSESWIVPEVCTSDSDNCLGTGIVDRVLIPIRVDRTKMLLGTNRGEVFVETGGAALQKLVVFAEDMLFVDFRVSNRLPAVGQAVSFEDASEKTDSAGDTVSRLWDFGDGTTSSATDPVHVYSAPGLYSGSFTVTTANSAETARKAAWITVGSPAATVDFEASSTSVSEGDSVVFTDLSVSSTEPITGRLWDFGDGRTSTNARPEHQYTQAGAFTVSLTVMTTNSSNTETKSNYIIVQRKVAPAARFSVNPSSPVALTTATFGDTSDAGSAPILEWFWDFSDGTTSREENPTHVFEAGGDYNVSLSVVSAHGSDTVTEVVAVQVVVPTAAFAISDATPFVLENVSFTNSSTDGSAPVTQHIWEFGDGASSVEENPTHAYNSAGDFEVRLTVVSAHGSNTASSPVTVSFMPPTAAFSAATQSPNVGDAVQFTDESTPGTAAVNSWLWDFGDPDSGAANASASQNPTHTYSASGFYTVTLTVRTPVSSNNTDTLVRTDYINAVQAPTPAFTSEATNPDEPDNVQFTDASVEGSEAIIGYLWDFNDIDSGANNSSTAQNPTHRFSTAGTFTVTLTVQTANRSASVSSMVTVVFIPPTVDFSVETVEDVPREGVLTDGALTTDTLQFNSLVTLGTEMDAGAFTYAWDFGDGNTSDLEEPTHSYDNGGTYTVTYTV